MVMGPGFYWYPLSILPFSLFRACLSGLPVFGEYLFPMHSKRSCHCCLEYEQVASISLQPQARSCVHHTGDTFYFFFSSCTVPQCWLSASFGCSVSHGSPVIDMTEIMKIPYNLWSCSVLNGFCSMTGGTPVIRNYNKESVCFTLLFLRSLLSY